MAVALRRDGVLLQRYLKRRDLLAMRVIHTDFNTLQANIDGLVTQIEGDLGQIIDYDRLNETLSVYLQRIDRLVDTHYTTIINGAVEHEQEGFRQTAEFWLGRLHRLIPRLQEVVVNESQVREASPSYVPFVMGPEGAYGNAGTFKQHLNKRLAGGAGTEVKIKTISTQHKQLLHQKMLEASAKGQGSAWTRDQFVRELRSELTSAELKRKMENNAMRIVRTEYGQASNAVTSKFTENNPEIFEELERVADGRPCLACVWLDGKRYPLGSDMDDHPNGMCTFVPVVKTLEEMGFEEKDIPKEFRSAWKQAERPVPIMQMQLLQLPEAEQLRVFGGNKELFELWKKEKLPLEKLLVKKNGVWQPASKKQLQDLLNANKLEGAVSNPTTVITPDTKTAFQLEWGIDTDANFWKEIDGLDRALPDSVITHQGDLKANGAWAELSTAEQDPMAALLKAWNADIEGTKTLFSQFGIPLPVDADLDTLKIGMELLSKHKPVEMYNAAMRKWGCAVRLSASREQYYLVPKKIFAQALKKLEPPPWKPPLKTAQRRKQMGLEPLKKATGAAESTTDFAASLSELTAEAITDRATTVIAGDGALEGQQLTVRRTLTSHNYQPIESYSFESKVLYNYTGEILANIRALPADVLLMDNNVYLYGDVRRIGGKAIQIERRSRALRDPNSGKAVYHIQLTVDKNTKVWIQWVNSSVDSTSVNGSQALAGYFQVTVNTVGKQLTLEEAAAFYREAIQKTFPKLSKKITAAVTKEEREMLFWRRLLWADDPNAATHLAKNNIQDLAQLREIAQKNLGLTPAQMKDLYLKAKDEVIGLTMQHRSTYAATKELDAWIKKHDVQLIHHSKANADELAKLIKGGQLSSTTTRWRSGVFTEGMSSSEDLATGGADFVFTRITDRPTAVSMRRYTLEFDKAELRRTDWFAYHGDAYGTTIGDEFLARQGRLAFLRDEMSAGFNGGNEVMFKGALDFRHLKRIRTGSMDAKLKLMNSFRDYGIWKVNGIPLDQLIVIG